MARIPEFVTQKHFISVPEKGGVASVVNDIWRRIVKRCDSSLMRNTNRHELIAALFSDTLDHEKREQDRRPPLWSYLRDRTFVELALAVAKAKGFVNVGQLHMSRAGQYFRLYVKQGGQLGETVCGLCEQLGLKRLGYSREVLRVMPLLEPIGSDELIIKKNQWEGARDILVKGLLAALSPQRRAAVGADRGRLLQGVLDKMYEGDEVEVYSPTESSHNIWFRQPVLLESLLAMKIYTREMLADESWNRLFCVAETGQWLLDPNIMESIASISGRSIAVIVADTAYTQKLKDGYSALDVQVTVETLPWWLHNQHMTFTIRGQMPKKGVFFERRLRALSISPVGLSSLDDLEIALENYFAYWTKAKTHDQKQVVTGDNIASAREELMPSDAARTSA